MLFSNVRTQFSSQSSVWATAFMYPEWSGTSDSSGACAVHGTSPVFDQFDRSGDCSVPNSSSKESTVCGHPLFDAGPGIVGQSSTESSTPSPSVSSVVIIVFRNSMLSSDW